MSNGIRLDLRIIEFDCDPDDITSEIGVNPKRTWKQGELIMAKASIRHKENGWELSSGLAEDQAFEEHLETLITMVKAHLQPFISVANKYYTELSCALYLDSNDRLPSVHLSKEAVQVLALLGCEIDFDIYRFSE